MSNLFKVSKKISLKDAGIMAKQYDDISAQIKMLEKTKKSLADSLKKFSKDSGTKTDNGFICDSNGYSFGITTPVSNVLKSDAGEKLISNGFSQLVTERVVYDVDEKGLTTAWKNGDMNEKFIASLYDSKNGSDRIFVKKAEEMLDIQIAASKVKR